MRQFNNLTEMKKYAKRHGESCLGMAYIDGFKDIDDFIKNCTHEVKVKFSLDGCEQFLEHLNISTLGSHTQYNLLTKCKSIDAVARCDWSKFSSTMQYNLLIIHKSKEAADQCDWGNFSPDMLYYLLLESDAYLPFAKPLH